MIIPESSEMTSMSEHTTMLNQETIGLLRMLDGAHSQSDQKQIQTSICLLLMITPMLIKVNLMSEHTHIKKKEIFGSLLQFQILYTHTHFYINHQLYHSDHPTSNNISSHLLNITNNSNQILESRSEESRMTRQHSS